MQTSISEFPEQRRQRITDPGQPGFIPVFSGDVYQLREFLEKFEKVSTAFNWTNEEKCNRFGLYLDHFAADMYSTLNALMRTDYRTMIRHFERLMVTDDIATIFAYQLRRAKQDSG